MTTSKRFAPLEELLAAIVTDDAEAVRLIGATPGIAQARVVRERLVVEVPHQLYAGRGATALHYACDARPRGRTWNPSAQRSVIEILLDAGSAIEHQEKTGATPLHRAVRGRSPEAVRCLLERGARVDATHGRQRTTSLHIVTHSTGASGTKGTRAEQQEIVALLLQHGANPRARDAAGHLPLRTAPRRRS